MAKQGFKQTGNFHLAANSAVGSPLTQGMVTKDVSGAEQRYLHNNGVNSVYLGALAGPATVTDATSGVNNVGVGAGALGSIDTTGASQAQNNTGIGGSALSALTIGNNNATVGGLAVLTTGSDNAAFGHEAGMQSGAGGVTTGSYNTFLGYRAGSAYRSSEASNIIIGAVNTGTLAESNTLRIAAATGTGNGEVNRAFICGIRGITTAVNDAVAVLVDSANQLGTVSSSLRYKTNIQDLGSQSEVIYSLKPKSFEFRQHPGSPAWGLIAEEVDEVFPQLCVYKDGQPETVKYHDLVPLLLNEVQKLRKELDELKSQ